MFSMLSTIDKFKTYPKLTPSAPLTFISKDEEVTKSFRKHLVAAIQKARELQKEYQMKETAKLDIKNRIKNKQALKDAAATSSKCKKEENDTKNIMKTNKIQSVEKTSLKDMADTSKKKTVALSITNELNLSDSKSKSPLKRKLQQDVSDDQLLFKKPAMKKLKKDGVGELPAATKPKSGVVARMEKFKEKITSNPAIVNGKPVKYLASKPSSFSKQVEENPKIINTPKSTSTDEPKSSIKTFQIKNILANRMKNSSIKPGNVLEKSTVVPPPHKKNVPTLEKQNEVRITKNVQLEEKKKIKQSNTPKIPECPPPQKKFTIPKKKNIPLPKIEHSSSSQLVIPKPASNTVSCDQCVVTPSLSRQNEDSEEAMEFDECSEEDNKMDWEVNEIRKTLKDRWCEESSINHATNDNQEFHGSCVIVIDTNVYISALPFVQNLLDTQLPEFGYPEIYVPHRVLNELDSIKDGPQIELGKSARQAVNFLNEKFCQKHPRVHGQTLKQYISLTLSPDDKILQSCILIRTSNPQKTVIFLSNDTNLRSKSLIEGFETFSVSDFEKIVLSKTEDCPLGNLTQAQLTYRLHSLVLYGLQQIWENEPFRNRKPRTLGDYIESFCQRWFSSRYTDHAQECLQVLRQSVKEKSEDRLLECLDAGMDFFYFFRVCSKPYFTAVRKTLKNLEQLGERIVETIGDTRGDYRLDKVARLRPYFVRCSNTVSEEVAKLDASRQLGVPVENLKVKQVEDFLVEVSSALENILQTPILQMKGCGAISQLAQAMSKIPEHNPEELYELIYPVTLLVVGRELLEEAQCVFSNSLNAVRTLYNGPSPFLL